MVGVSAELLRRAAALMRERAEAATPSADPHPGGWAGYSRPADLGDCWIFGGPAVDGYRTGTVLAFPEYTDCEDCGRPSDADVQHIASWHPAVALAVADLLREAEATYIVLSGPGVVGAPDSDEFIAAAVRLARAYLGEPS